MKQLRNFALLLMLVSLVSVPYVLAQPQFEVPLTVTDVTAVPTTLYFGILPTANFCIVPADSFNGHAEFMQPPLPAGGFYTKLVWPRAGSNAACFDLGSIVDFRPFTAYAEKDTFKFFAMTDGVSMVLTWNQADLATKFVHATLHYTGGSGGVDINMMTTGTADVSDGLNPSINWTIYTDGLAIPPSPPPIFSASPSPMDFGTVNLGTPTTHTLTISNTGVAPPVADLVINTAPVAPAGYTVTPNPPATFPLNIAPGASYNFDVTAPTGVAGTFAGDIVFDHNGILPGPISPTNVHVTITVISNALVFAADARTHIEDAISFQDTIGLVYQGPGNLKALQFRLVMQGNGTSGLSLQGVTRGDTLNAGTYSFATQVHYGPANGDGTLNDTVSIVIYGNGSNTIVPGTYNDLVRFRYGVGHVSPHGVQVAHVQLLDVFASYPNGDPISLSADVAQNDTIKPAGVGGYQYGDVNHDFSVDILDLLKVVDYILGRNPTNFDFTLADLAPWTLGNAAPSADGVVNVQDLALLQQIILTGMYPSGLPSFRPNLNPPVVPSLAKGTTLSPGMDVKLTFYMSETGIAVRMESIVKVKGIQLEFGNVASVPSTMSITTLLGDGPYVCSDNKLRVLMYNQEARTVDPGDVMVANIPFDIANPEAITLNRFIVASELNTRIEKTEIEIIRGSAPELPVEYMLSQNYPNPFNPSTSVSFSVPQLTDVKVAIYNMLGQEVQTLFNQKMDRGTKVVVWNGFDRNGVAAASGPYIVRMIAGDFVASRKMMFIK